MLCWCYSTMHVDCLPNGLGMFVQWVWTLLSVCTQQLSVVEELQFIFATLSLNSRLAFSLYTPVVVCDF